MNIPQILTNLNIHEKIDLLTAANDWYTVAVERAGIPPVCMSDGPNGLRKEKEGKSIPSTAFPTLSSMASGWDTESMRQVAGLLARIANESGVDVLLGPGCNIKRNPLCGRNFEYFSEDPYLAGTLAAAYIDGLQTNGISACLKHFAGNNQEWDRFFLSSEIGPRALFEIYLKPFEIAVKSAKPDSIMCAYNRLNGVYCSENRYLLEEVLRKLWGYTGLIVSDWGAVKNRAYSLKAGINLEVPYKPYSHQAVEQALADGKITEAEIDRSVAFLLQFIQTVESRKPRRSLPPEQSVIQKAARDAAANNIVLLKNQEDLLPLSSSKKRIAVLGRYAVEPLISGGGSADVPPAWLDIPLDELKKEMPWAEINYADGYIIRYGQPTVFGYSDGIRAAHSSDAAIVFVGNCVTEEREEYDRRSLRLAPCLEDLILKTAQAQPNTIVVICAGSVVDVSAWQEQVKAIVYAGFAGCGMGNALARIISGKVNPSGKLAESFPLSWEQSAAYRDYPGNGFYVNYSEDNLVGYRYYDTLDMPVRYPFGFGLSYTRFGYSELSVTDASDDVQVSFRVTNIGKAAGKEVVQVYSGQPHARVRRPLRELRRFEKIKLEAGESKTVCFTIPKSELGYYSLNQNGFITDNGIYRFEVGASSRDIRLSGEILLNDRDCFITL